MKRIMALLLAVVMAVCVASCGKSQPKIEVVKNEQNVKAEKLDIPMELQGYEHVNLTGFDGQYAIFKIERERLIGKELHELECARIVVYDVINRRTVHVLNLDYPYGRVGGAVKDGNKLYFTVFYYGELKEEIYVNDGLETRKIADFEMNTRMNFSRLYKSDDLIVLEHNNGSFDNYDYHYYLIKDEKLEKIGEFKQQNQGFAQITGYKEGKLIIAETEISDDGYVYFNKWTGDEKETVFRLVEEHSHAYKKLGNMFIHPVDSIDNDNRYKMMAVTDLDNKNVTEIGMMQGGFFGSCGGRGLMFTYGKSVEQVLLFEAGENVLNITPVEIDVQGKYNHTYYMTENIALMKIAVTYEGDFELYILEY